MAQKLVVVSLEQERMFVVEWALLAAGEADLGYTGASSGCVHHECLQGCVLYSQNHKEALISEHNLHRLETRRKWFTMWCEHNTFL